MDTKKEKFGDRIRKLRKLNGISSERLGEILGKRDSTVRSWETNVSYPNYKTIVAIVEYFNCSYDYLFGKEPLTKERILVIEKGVERILEEVKELSKQKNHGE